MKLPLDEIRDDLPGREIFISGACIRGARHKKEGLPCQDAWASFPVHGGGWVIAAADGLSSAPHADEGAKIASQMSGERLASVLSRESDSSGIHEQIREAARTAKNAILSRARDNEDSPASYASTLMILVYKDGTAVIGHIGDGMIAGVSEGRTLIISEPDTGEYANETACLVQEDWEDHLRFSECKDIEACIIATDGCQNALATRSDGKYTPHDPFILPLVSFVRQRLTAGIDPRADIASLLVSNRMEQLSGDDKTLIVLTGKEMIQPG